MVMHLRSSTGIPIWHGYVFKHNKGQAHAVVYSSWQNRTKRGKGVYIRLDKQVAAREEFFWLGLFESSSLNNKTKQLPLGCGSIPANTPRRFVRTHQVLRVDLNPLKKQFTRSQGRNKRINFRFLFFDLVQHTSLVHFFKKRVGESILTFRTLDLVDFFFQGIQVQDTSDIHSQGDGVTISAHIEAEKCPCVPGDPPPPPPPPPPPRSFFFFPPNNLLDPKTPKK